MIEEVRKEFAGVKGMVKGFSGSGTRQLAARGKKRDLATATPGIWQSEKRKGI